MKQGQQSSSSGKNKPSVSPTSNPINVSEALASLSLGLEQKNLHITQEGSTLHIRPAQEATGRSSRREREIQINIPPSHPNYHQVFNMLLTGINMATRPQQPTQNNQPIPAPSSSSSQSPTTPPDKSKKKEEGKKEEKERKQEKEEKEERKEKTSPVLALPRFPYCSLPENKEGFFPVPITKKKKAAPLTPEKNIERITHWYEDFSPLTSNPEKELKAIRESVQKAIPNAKAENLMRRIAFLEAHWSHFSTVRTVKESKDFQKGISLSSHLDLRLSLEAIIQEYFLHKSIGDQENLEESQGCLDRLGAWLHRAHKQFATSSDELSLMKSAEWKECLDRYQIAHQTLQGKQNKYYAQRKKQAAEHFVPVPEALQASLNGMNTLMRSAHQALRTNTTYMVPKEDLEKFLGYLTEFTTIFSEAAATLSPSGQMEAILQMATHFYTLEQHFLLPKRMPSSYLTLKASIQEKTKGCLTSWLTSFLPSHTEYFYTYLRNTIEYNRLVLLNPNTPPDQASRCISILEASCTLLGKAIEYLPKDDNVNKKKFFQSLLAASTYSTTFFSHALDCHTLKEENEYLLYRWNQRTISEIDLYKRRIEQYLSTPLPSGEERLTLEENLIYLLISLTQCYSHGARIGMLVYKEQKSNSLLKDIHEAMSNATQYIETITAPSYTIKRAGQDGLYFTTCHLYDAVKETFDPWAKEYPYPSQEEKKGEEKLPAQPGQQEGNANQNAPEEKKQEEGKTAQPQKEGKAEEKQPADKLPHPKASSHKKRHKKKSKGVERKQEEAPQEEGQKAKADAEKAKVAEQARLEEKKKQDEVERLKKEEVKKQEDLLKAKAAVAERARQKKEQEVKAKEVEQAKLAEKKKQDEVERLKKEEAKKQEDALKAKAAAAEQAKVKQGTKAKEVEQEKLKKKAVLLPTPTLLPLPFPPGFSPKGLDRNKKLHTHIAKPQESRAITKEKVIEAQQRKELEAKAEVEKERLEKEKVEQKKQEEQKALEAKAAAEKARLEKEAEKKKQEEARKRQEEAKKQEAALKQKKEQEAKAVAAEQARGKTEEKQLTQPGNRAYLYRPKPAGKKPEDKGKNAKKLRAEADEFTPITILPRQREEKSLEDKAAAILTEIYPHIQPLMKELITDCHTFYSRGFVLYQKPLASFPAFQTLFLSEEDKVEAENVGNEAAASFPTSFTQLGVEPPLRDHELNARSTKIMATNQKIIDLLYPSIKAFHAAYINYSNSPPPGPISFSLTTLFPDFGLQTPAPLSGSFSSSVRAGQAAIGQGGGYHR